MRAFDLAAAKAGAAVVTMHGHRAKILCFDKKGELPVVAIVDFENHEVVYDYFEDGTTPHFAPLRLALMMRDDDYLEKLERGEYGNHIDEATEKVDPTIKENLTVDREYWRRVYAGQMMAAAFPVLVSTDWQAKGEYANIPAETLIARQAIDFADALLEELEKTEKKL